MYQDEGIEGLASFGYNGTACRLAEAQQERLKAWVSETLPRTTREVGPFIAQEFGIDYQSRGGLIKLLHRLGLEHRKPKTMAHARWTRRSRRRSTSATTSEPVDG